MVTATRTPTRNRHRSTSNTANGTVGRRNNFEFDAPQWEDFTLPQYTQQRILLEAIVYPQAVAQSQSSEQAQVQDEWTVTQLIIPHEGEGHEEFGETADDEDWFQRPHAEHEPTSPYSPAGPLISPSPAMSKPIIATASPAARGSGRRYSSSLGRVDGENLSVGRENSSIGGSLSRMGGAHRECSSPRPALRGKPMRVPRPGGGAVVNEATTTSAGAKNDGNNNNGHRSSGPADSVVSTSDASSRGSFMSILSASGAISDIKSPLGRRGKGKGVNSNPVGRVRALVNSSSPLGGSPMLTRDSLGVDLFPPGSPMLGSPLSRNVSRNARQQQQLKSTRLPRTSASIEESLLADREDDHDERDDDNHESKYGQDASSDKDFEHEPSHAYDYNYENDNDRVQGRNSNHYSERGLPPLAQASDLPPTNWSSSIPATPPILTAHLLKLLDQADNGGGGTGVEQELRPVKEDPHRTGEDDDEQKNKRSHSPLHATRVGIGLRAMRVPAVNHLSLPPPHAPVRASPLQLPVVKRVKVDGRFCPAPPPGKVCSRSASPPPPPPPQTSNATTMAQAAVPMVKKEKPIKLDDLKKLLAEHNQKLRPHPHNNITRRR